MGKSELGKKMNRKYFTYPNILVHTVVALLLWGLFTFFRLHNKQSKSKRNRL